MKDSNDKWIGYGQGDSGSKVADLKEFMRRKFASYAGDLHDTDVYDDQMVDAVREMQQRYGLPVTGIINYQTQVKMGFIYSPDPIKPIMFTVEGHLSDMFSGPVADTAAALETEGHCRHQPIGYQNGSIPFDNSSGVAELARLVGKTTLDNGTPFPEGTPWALGTYSQGGIVGFDFYTQYLQPNQELHWRAADLVGVLAYGNPCRQTGSVAPWARPWASDLSLHGLDPYARFGLPGFPDEPAHPWADVLRAGDIFAENGDDKASEVKAAVYQAVARADIFSDPYSLAAQIADLFAEPFDEVWGMIMAIVSGIQFLAEGQGSAHYAPYDIGGGIDWMRERLTARKGIAS